MVQIRAPTVANPRARKGTSASITDFLNHALVDGAVDVAGLEAKARVAGLLGERQKIQHAKAFKKAKKALGIQSIRNGFGSGGQWAWSMPLQAVQIEPRLSDSAGALSGSFASRALSGSFASPTEG
jgi:hypothetical protein